MNAIDNYNATYKRCISLVSLFKDMKQEKKGIESSHEMNDILRGAIVLIVAAMDNYFTSKFTEMLIPYLKKKDINEDLATLIQKSGIDYKSALNLIKKDKPLVHIKNSISKYFSRYVTQKTETIDDLYKCYGITKLSENAERFSNNNNLLLSIKRTVNRRNSIAHAGDLNGSNSHLKDITAGDVTKKINSINTYIEFCDKILNNLIH